MDINGILKNLKTLYEASATEEEWRTIEGVDFELLEEE